MCVVRLNLQPQFGTQLDLKFNLNMSKYCQPKENRSKRTILRTTWIRPKCFLICGFGKSILSLARFGVVVVVFVVVFHCRKHAYMCQFIKITLNETVKVKKKIKTISTLIIVCCLSRCSRSGLPSLSFSPILDFTHDDNGLHLSSARLSDT